MKFNGTERFSGTIDKKKSVSGTTVTFCNIEFHNRNRNSKLTQIEIYHFRTHKASIPFVPPVYMVWYNLTTAHYSKALFTRSVCKRKRREWVWTHPWCLTQTQEPFFASNVNADVRAHLHQALASTLRQLCNDASNSVLSENNGVAWKWVATLFWSDCIVFNENSITSIIKESLQHWR